MDPQVRNFKDFILLYNQLTEICFKSCVDGFYRRSLEPEETSCVDNCFQKFAGLNQRITNVYVEVQTAINTRRMAELEAQAQEAAKQATNLVPKSSLSVTENEPQIAIDSSR